MRIAYAYDALYPEVTGGAERRYFELGERLAARGHEVHFVSWRFPASGTIRHARVHLHGVGRAPHLHDADGKRTFREAALFAIRAIPALACLHADVIDCSSIPYASTFIVAALRRRSRMVVTWHEYMGERWLTYLRRGASMAARVEAATARLGDERVAVSAFTARRLPAGPVTRVVENGVDIDGIQAAHPSASAPDLVVAGRLVPHKRIDLMLEALARVPGATAAIIGDGPERTRLERLATALGLRDRVRFVGWLPDAARLYGYLRGARALITLSEQEGFGMTVVEAQAAGAVPIVARGDFSAAADLVDHDVSGLIVDPEREAIAHAIEYVLRDDRARESMSMQGMRAARRYDWDVISERMEQVYIGAQVAVEQDELVVAV